MPSGFRPPITLSGRFVALTPLSQADVPDLELAGQDPEIWRYVLSGDLRVPGAMARFVSELLDRQAAGTDLPFTVRSLPSRTPIGMTRYLGIRRADRGVEIGGTWYDRSHQRTAVNTEAKYLLLQHAFEAERCERVELRTDFRNERSQRAISRLGAYREGILRQDRVRPDGYVRDTVVYSIVADEWPTIRRRLERFLADGTYGFRSSEKPKTQEHVQRLRPG